MRRPHILALGIVLVLVAALIGVLGDRVCRTPVDVSGTARLPDWLVDLKERDEFAYPAHALIGTLLNDAGCSPVAAGLQWIKAGAHIRTEQDVEVVWQGLSASRTRADSSDAFDHALCRFVAGGFSNAQQAAVTQRAGVNCE